MAQPIIETERLTLRPVTQADFEVVHPHASDPQVTSDMDWGPNDEATTRAFLSMAEAGSSTDAPVAWDFVLIEKAGNLFRGVAGIHAHSHGCYEIGYWLTRESWGHGLGTEAARRLVELGFAELNAHRVEARCHPANTRSARVLLKCGMTPEGTLRESVFVRGQWQDREVYSVLVHEWPDE